MASALTDKLSRLVKQISGQARITESNVADMLREVRMALLEADVALPVVRDFIARVKDKALGQEVIGSLQPGQALVAIVNQELTATMGEGVSDLNLAAQPPAVILMAGLQGAGNGDRSSWRRMVPQLARPKARRHCPRRARLRSKTLL